MGEKSTVVHGHTYRGSEQQKDQRCWATYSTYQPTGMGVTIIHTHASEHKPTLHKLSAACNNYKFVTI